MKIFVNGLQRTGTNYVKQLLQANTDLDIHDWRNPYWKHDLYNNIIPDCDQVICVIKNPYTWIESICFRNCVDIKDMYPQLHSNVDYIGPFKINLIEACKLYKIFYQSWLAQGVILVHYEDMLDITFVTDFLEKNYNIIDREIIIPNNVNFSKFFKQTQIEPYKSYKTFHLVNNNINAINCVLGQEFINIINYPIK